MPSVPLAPPHKIGTGHCRLVSPQSCPWVSAYRVTRLLNMWHFRALLLAKALPRLPTTESLNIFVPHFWKTCSLVVKTLVYKRQIHRSDELQRCKCISSQKWINKGPCRDSWDSANVIRTLSSSPLLLVCWPHALHGIESGVISLQLKVMCEE